MRLYFSTLVSCSINEVWEKFDQDLFLALNPPFAPRVGILASTAIVGQLDHRTTNQHRENCLC